MKLFLSFLIVAACAHTCFAQDIAAVMSISNEHSSYHSASLAAAGRAHEPTTLGNVGTWTMLGGVAVVIGGYIEVKSATKTYGPFTIVDQSKQNAGHAIEILGGGLFTAGLTMIIINSVNRHHQGSKVSLTAPKSNEVGIAYNL